MNMYERLKPETKILILSTQQKISGETHFRVRRPGSEQFTSKSSNGTYVNSVTNMHFDAQCHLWMTFSYEILPNVSVP